MDYQYSQPLSSVAQDRLWISETLAGSHEAYARLITKYKSQLFDLTCRVLKNNSQGEDILQDAFLKAYRSLKNFRNESTFSTWIYAIVMNGLRNHLRRNKVIHWSSLDAPRLGLDESCAPEPVFAEPSMDALVERKMTLEDIQGIAAGFPLVHQSIFTMYYFQCLTLPEIAERLGRPLGTVKVYLHRSRKMLYSGFKRRSMAPRLFIRPRQVVLAGV